MRTETTHTIIQWSAAPPASRLLPDGGWVGSSLGFGPASRKSGLQSHGPSQTSALRNSRTQHTRSPHTHPAPPHTPRTHTHSPHPHTPHAPTPLASARPLYGTPNLVPSSFRDLRLERRSEWPRRGWTSERGSPELGTILE